MFSILLRLVALMGLALALSVPQHHRAHLEKRMLKTLSGSLVDAFSAMSTSVTSVFKSAPDVIPALASSADTISIKVPVADLPSTPRIGADVAAEQTGEQLSKAAARRALKEKAQKLKKAQEGLPAGQKMSRAALKKAAAKLSPDDPLMNADSLMPVKNGKPIEPVADANPNLFDTDGFWEAKGEQKALKALDGPTPEDEAKIAAQKIKESLKDPDRGVTGIQRKYECAIDGGTFVIKKANIVRDLFEPALSRGTFLKGTLKSYGIKPDHMSKECQNLDSVEHNTVFPENSSQNAFRVFYGMVKDAPPIFCGIFAHGSAVDNSYVPCKGVD
jgi:hypothetical protein